MIYKSIFKTTTIDRTSNINSVTIIINIFRNFEINYLILLKD